MLGVANIYTHVGDGIGIGLFSGKANIMTKWAMEPHYQRCLAKAIV